MKFSCISWLFVVFFAGTIAHCHAQQGSDEDNPFAPGLFAAYRDGKVHTATRIDHQLSFHWLDAVPDPRLAPGEFRASWQGHLRVRTHGDHRFQLFGSGEAELKLDGKVIIARQVLSNGWLESRPVALAAEDVPLELTFRRTDAQARLMVLWSGPRFGMEPIPPRLLVHERKHAPGSEFERGRFLARALRCGRCHGGEQQGTAGPALDRLAGNVSRDWLKHWLVAEHIREPEPKADAGEPVSPRRMPALGLAAKEAEAVADCLLIRPTKPPVEEAPLITPKVKPDARQGERLFVSLGCLACHTWRDLGSSGWFGGGDLTHIAEKRPPEFFAAWLADPAPFNRDHRMPSFTLTALERTSLGMFLADQKAPEAKPNFAVGDAGPRAMQGKKLLEQFHCARCHRLPDVEPPPAREPIAPRLGAASDWTHSCLGAADPGKHRPGYSVSERDARALRGYYAGVRTPRVDGQLLLAESNCLACHPREGSRAAIPLLPPVLADKLQAVAKRYPDLAGQVPALTPPALNSVGDKLTDQALAEVIARKGEPHRPYLQVRMPRFPLREDEVQTLVRHLVAADRVPERKPAQAPDSSRRQRYLVAGGRLVSSEGFGCTSCHQVGSVLPSKAQLNTLGPNLSRIERRIRREWFDRWVRDPARIVPRMEMPSVQIPVAGVLNGNLDEQLAAVWHVLNLPGFEPPSTAPLRTLHQLGINPAAEPLLVTDIVHHGQRALVKPFLVGLANRHNVLLDLEAGALTLWTAGDTASQRTRGKSWFWELAGTPVLDTGLTTPDLSLLVGDRESSAQPQGQYVTEADAWQTEGSSLALEYRLAFVLPGAKPVIVNVKRTFTPLGPSKDASGAGVIEALSVGTLPVGVRLRLTVLSPKVAAMATLSADGRVLRLGDRFGSRIELREPQGAVFAADRTAVVLAPGARDIVRVVLHYVTEMAIDRAPEPPAQPVGNRKLEPVEIAPGFTGERLPLPAEIMPTGLTWRPDGRLVFTSLRGQLFEASSSKGDGCEDRLTVLADGLPAPYGACAGPGYVDVSAKYALLRVRDSESSVRRVETIASGWGYTLDYHDWAVGLPRNERGEYFLGIPCQENQRSASAARFHGNVLKLQPRTPTAADPRRFALEPVSAGHRFPMGLALNHAGDLFVTDNQGNYKPFNELNHVRQGANFGFISFPDRAREAPRRTMPAIDIPHPWTRSVNGICFLYTPKELRARLGHDVFGPMEGHLIGCEYDTRRLIRMSLQKLGDTYQGAAYPLSIPPAGPARGFLGPLVCGVSPRGELYVGSIRDSGWGAGNNIGEIVRVRVDPDRFPCGIAEVRATHDGFVLDFLRPIDRALGGMADSYRIESYRREATPAYGGPDRDRRVEKVSGIKVADDARRVTLRLADMRPGFVYEFRLKNLAPDGKDFHPAEAHYTLRLVPE